MANRAEAPVGRFIARWQGGPGGQERANYAMFLCELCEVLEVGLPNPAGDPERNDYVFERLVREPQRDGSTASRRIDLYKRDCFVLEAKQSRLLETGARRFASEPDRPAAASGQRALRGAAGRWDMLMSRARVQAENYVRLLPEDHQPPPFVIVCDVGYCFELYANFRRDGKAYGPFPDWCSFRIYLEDLRHAQVRELLQAIWTDPLLLDPGRRLRSLVFPPWSRRAG